MRDMSEFNPKIIGILDKPDKDAIPYLYVEFDYQGEPCSGYFSMVGWQRAPQAMIEDFRARVALPPIVIARTGPVRRHRR